MMPNVVRGDRMVGLVSYLVGPGRANEHTHPMIVAGDDRVTFQFEPGAELDAHDAFEIGYILDQPRRAHGTRVTAPVKRFDEATGEQVKVGEKDAHVWHCSLSLRDDDRAVSADEWGKIAQRFVEEMGFVDPDGAKSSRWVAVHHGVSKNGNDHIHIAVQLVREDGTKANVHRDFKRAQDACAQLEKEFGLAVVEGRGESKNLSGYKGAEQARANRAGDSLAVPVQLRQRLRGALATAGSPLEYLQAVQEAGVKIAPAFQKGSNIAVRGYKVALDGEAYTTANGQHVYASPSKLDASLSWPNVCARFGGKGQAEAEEYLRSLHSSQRRPANRGAVRPARLNRPVHPVHVGRLLDGTGDLGPDTLANVYARLALEHEAGKDGPYGRLSERMARGMASAHSGAYRVRQAGRFAASGDRGWLAVVNQANRLSRALAGAQMSASRPSLARDVAALIGAAERLHRHGGGLAPARGVETEQITQRGAGHGRG